MTDHADLYSQIITELREQREVSRGLAQEVAGCTSALAAMGTRLSAHMEWSKSAHSQRDISCEIHKKETALNTAWKEQQDRRIDDILKAMAGLIAIGTFLMLFKDALIRVWDRLFR